MAKLVIFDIDGTLVDSAEVDAACFVRAITEEFGIEDIDERWDTYENVTDSGIFEEIFERAFSRKPSASEIKRHITRFSDLLKQYRFREINGARDILKMLRKHPEWKVGIATGGWRESALLKLRGAGLEVDGIPIVTSSEVKSREDLVRKCMDISKAHYAVKEFERIVSVGDGIWDLKVANKLEIAFVGINMMHKIPVSADHKMVSDYTDQEVFMSCLEG